MAITGATFNFNKTVTTEEETPTAERPVAGGTPTPKVAGEKTDLQSVKTAVGLDQARRIAETAINSALASVEGSQAKVQINALKKGVSDAFSLGASFAINPVLGAVNLTTQAISAGAEQARQERQKQWSDYDLSEYNRMRGYNAAYNRSRSD